MKKKVKINDKEVQIKVRSPFAPAEKAFRDKKKYSRKKKHK